MKVRRMNRTSQPVDGIISMRLWRYHSDAWLLNLYKMYNEEINGRSSYRAKPSRTLDYKSLNYPKHFLPCSLSFWGFMNIILLTYLLFAILLFSIEMEKVLLAMYMENVIRINCFRPDWRNWWILIDLVDLVPSRTSFVHNQYPA